jgi:hypothetical protein
MALARCNKSRTRGVVLCMVQCRIAWLEAALTRRVGDVDRFNSS